jgi:hypothetical protein
MLEIKRDKDEEWEFSRRDEENERRLERRKQVTILTDIYMYI